MQIKALRDEVIVKRIDQSETSKGGLVIPDVARKCMKAIVLSVGKRLVRHKKEVEPEVSVGDTVVFPRGTGQIIDTGKEKLLMLKHEDILGKIA